MFLLAEAIDGWERIATIGGAIWVVIQVLDWIIELKIKPALQARANQATPTPACHFNPQLEPVLHSLADAQLRTEKHLSSLVAVVREQATVQAVRHEAIRDQLNLIQQNTRDG